MSDEIPSPAPQETHDQKPIGNPMNLTAAELRREYDAALATIASQADHIAVLNAVIREHNEFGALFQPGGRFHRAADLPLGRSAVMEGGRWLVKQYDDLVQINASLRDNNAHVKALFDERAIMYAETLQRAEAAESANVALSARVQQLTRELEDAR
jgi:hypothetical protein